MVKVFLDGANEVTMLALKDEVDGFTTNPSLMRKQGVRDVGRFAKRLVKEIPDKPISFEVLGDNVRTIEHQARTIAGWGENVYVKVPVMLGNGQDTFELIHDLAHEAIKINVTAVMTLSQTHSAVEALVGGAPSIVSVFAGRIADTGRDPSRIVSGAVGCAFKYRWWSGNARTRAEILWASTREVYNLRQAQEAGADIITLSPELLLKSRALVNRDLHDYSLETVQQFHHDGKGLTL